MSLKNIFYPNSVAVIGASKTKGKVGYSIIRNLKNFKGNVYPVNPKYKNLLGMKCYSSVLDVEDEIDLAVIAVPNIIVPKVLEECGEKNIRGAVIITAGFSEVGNYELENKIREIAKNYGIRIIGPNCLGIMNTHLDLNATFASIFPPKGKVSIVSQSGAILDAILDIAPLLNIGFSKVVSIGNKVDIQESDLLEYFIKDDDTEIVVLYIEGLKDKKFLKSAKKLSRKKPIIALKSGKTEIGKKAVKSHTGALAGEDSIYEAVFKEAGIIRAYTFEELVDLIHIFSTQPIIKSNKIAIITNAGGFGVLAADACVEHGMKLANFDKSTISKLKDVLPPTANISNPLDIIGDAPPERYEKCTELLGKDKNTDGILVVLTPQEMTKPIDVARSLVKIKNNCREVKNKPLITSFVGGVSVKDVKGYLRRRGIPSYLTPENGVKALSRLYNYSLMKVRKDYDEELEKIKEKFLKIRDKNRDYIDNLLKSPNEYKAKKLLDFYELPVPECYLAKNENEALEFCKKLGKCVMKIVSPEIIHKTEVGGVIINPDNPKKAYNTLVNNAKKHDPNVRIEGVLVEKFIDEEKIEVIVGAKRDKIFGPVLMVGLGGIFVEVLDDVSFGVYPITREFAVDMIKDLKSYKILEGVRGRKRKDINFLVECLMKIGVIMDIHEEIKEIDLNPVFVFNDGNGGCIGDARIII
ncbi:acetyl coenzyme A synthetase (ADP forming), alpha domain protein [Methanothermus fervidus DSM 2088]|uniref:acetate--CoA ligase (ADP-forming) n=1 Tax=Methanothermus fervidus (strain ATCC 43054 / DSM 2088 / JCM 10308 / V24 S) TaxID=523846 RepID=E3GW31_METFV|nr:acetate--CoA ligase [Methanothermus fervidus]ADP77796.1 acetyl coenzyme A synthetase (ADP forming), alpha domain protein [Methanothermus fervidus DSM 2088]